MVVVVVAECNSWVQAVKVCSQSFGEADKSETQSLDAQDRKAGWWNSVCTTSRWRGEGEEEEAASAGGSVVVDAAAAEENHWLQLLLLVVVVVAVCVGASRPKSCTHVSKCGVVVVVVVVVGGAVARRRSMCKHPRRGRNRTGKEQWWGERATVGKSEDSA